MISQTPSAGDKRKREILSFDVRKSIRTEFESTSSVNKASGHIIHAPKTSQTSSATQSKSSADVSRRSSDSDEPQMTGWKCKSPKHRPPPSSGISTSARSSQGVIEISSDEDNSPAVVCRNVRASKAAPILSRTTDATGSHAATVNLPPPTTARLSEAPNTLSFKRSISLIDLTIEDDNDSPVPPSPKRQRCSHGNAPSKEVITISDTDDETKEDGVAGFNSLHTSEPSGARVTKAQPIIILDTDDDGDNDEDYDNLHAGFLPWSDDLMKGDHQRVSDDGLNPLEATFGALSLNHTSRIEYRPRALPVWSPIPHASFEGKERKYKGATLFNPRFVGGNIPEWLPGHFMNSNDPGGVGGHNQRKYYDVLCARFDPNNANFFASTGCDGVVTVWGLSSSFEKGPSTSRSHAHTFETQDDSTFISIKRWGKETYGDFYCHDVVYRSQMLSGECSLFASPCSDGRLFVNSYTTGDHDSVSDFTVQGLWNPKGNSRRTNDSLEDDIQQVGATVWGHRTTSNEVFVCSERLSCEALYHGAFDFVAGKHIYHFDDHRNGEELALDPEGTSFANLLFAAVYGIIGGKIALFTSHEDRLFFRTYDVRHKLEKHCAEVELPPGPRNPDPEFCREVSKSVWSPDGLLLAVGSNEDDVYIYDVRQLRQSVGPILSLNHKTHTRSHFGITVLEWTTENRFCKTQRLGLLTGGADHCVALWDINTACKERRVVAELQGQVGVGHFGDLSRGEKPLVAGDTDGHVYIYDFKTSNS
ncbi:hypothetical protein BU17DRAFT_81108 [Hysterangium stoloniferum]|nr:hypothetical protein BU17DRAFT_81108 [Hysterangium stoloniferum]